jgi:uncharacterized protein involved in oxidation of intracellular sulfur
MKLGIVVYSTDAETVWNAFRLGNFALKEGDEVKAFLLASGVEAESLSNETYDISGMMQDLVDNGGEILACGTCLKIRNKEGTELCPMSTMKDLYEIIRDSDKVVTF